MRLLSFDATGHLLPLVSLFALCDASPVPMPIFGSRNFVVTMFPLLAFETSAVSLDLAPDICPLDYTGFDYADGSLYETFLQQVRFEERGLGRCVVRDSLFFDTVAPNTLC